jgi:hypothetical protein
MKKGKLFAKRMVWKALGKANSEDDSERSELAIPLNPGSFVVSAWGLREENLFFDKKWMVTSKEF